MLLFSFKSENEESAIRGMVCCLGVLIYVVTVEYHLLGFDGVSNV